MRVSNPVRARSECEPLHQKTTTIIDRKVRALYPNQQPQQYPPSQPMQQPYQPVPQQYQQPQQYGQPPMSAPPQQQYQQPQQPIFNGQPAPAAAPQFRAPTGGGEAGPRIKDLGVGRLIALRPTKIETVANTYKNAAPGSTVDKMTADLWVLDGDPFAFGGSEDATPPRAHDKLGHPVAKFAGTWISQSAIVNSCRDTLAEVQRGVPAMIVGRLARAEKSGAWILTTPTEADLAIAGNAIPGWNANRIDPLHVPPTHGIPQVAQQPYATPAMQHAAYAAAGYAPQQMPQQVQQYVQQPMQQPQYAQPTPQQGWASQQPVQQPMQQPQYAQQQPDPATAYLASPDPAAQYGNPQAGQATPGQQPPPGWQPV